MITLYIKDNQVSKYTGDCFITRTIERNLFDITLLTSTGTAFPMTGILTWEIGITEDFKRHTPILAGSSTVTANQNVLSVSLNAHTIQMRAFLEGKRGAPLYATLRGFNGASEAVYALVFPVMAYNVGYELDDPTAQAVDELHYTKAETDALLENIAETLNVPSDLSDLSDDTGILDDKADVGQALPPGGASGDILHKTTSEDYASGWVPFPGELAANKTTTIDVEAPSDTKYTSERAVVDYVDGMLGDIEAALDGILGV